MVCDEVLGVLYVCFIVVSINWVGGERDWFGWRNSLEFGWVGVWLWIFSLVRVVVRL